ncbi:MAG: cysteine peptidase family C39 domain-containing protein, partial [Coprobacillus sp.]
MNKYPIEMQDEEKACGAYCILMILKYFGYKEEVKYIKRKARLNQNGISLKGMIECLKTYQIESKAYEATLDQIKDEVTLPCILFMVYENIGHYVVLYEIKDDEYIIGDPARGLISIYREEMDDHYALRMLSIIHVGRVPTLTYKPYYRFLLETMKSYKKHVISLIIKGFWISVLGYGSSYFFQIIIDYIHIDTKFFYIIVICLIYSFIEIIKTTLERIKTTQVIRLKKAIDEDYVFISSMNMLTLPYNFFYQDKGYIQSELLSLFDLSDMNIECFERLFLDGLSFIVFLIGMMLINFYMSIVVIVMLIIIGILSYVRLKSLQEIYKNYLESQFIYQHHLLELIEN